MASFEHRHIGPTSTDTEVMLAKIGTSSLSQLVQETVPEAIQMTTPLDVPEPLSEPEILENLEAIMSQNEPMTSYIGMGYSNTHTPSVIQRCIFENPGWYTQYTPYQAEISQGRLEALMNFQTMICDLTAMPIANASLLDEATAAAEAMTLLYRVREKSKKESKVFAVSSRIWPQTRAVLETRAEPLGIEIKSFCPVVDELDNTVFGVLLQYPNSEGYLRDYSPFIEKCHAADIKVAMATDLLALCVLKAPGEMGADVVVGNSQRFGVPLGYGGPHAGFMACQESFYRQMPGRIIGTSIDRHERPAYRMALQTREQHIRREKATSNICTAQALLAIMAGMFAVYHGPAGLREIATKVAKQTQWLWSGLESLGLKIENPSAFDTITIVTGDQTDAIHTEARKQHINFREFTENRLIIALDETVDDSRLKQILSIFETVLGKTASTTVSLPDLDFGGLTRQSDYLTHEVFHRYQSETEMMRYLKRLENKDLSLTAAMIPLGSCTMKLNAATQMKPLSWASVSKVHPFAPLSQVQGYRQLFEELETQLGTITGLPGVSLQPNSGAQGEYAGLMVIRAYHISQGNTDRTVVLIPSSAHGTNPASAALAGMDIVIIKCDDNGNIDMADLTAKAEKHKDKLSCLMITYPSTHGVFEETIQDICQLIHDNGGQVYMDGANMNAQVGLTNPGIIGADVCHLNLHKTFSIPHGGGGPGMGPICVADHLSPFLPKHPVVEMGGAQGIPPVSAAPWGSSSILLISYAYIRLLGPSGLKHATEYAILNANYIKARLESDYQVLFTGKNDRVAHELIIDFRAFKKSAKIEVEDIAKRLMDFGFHSPTMSWPVPGTLMIEPTESESLRELDRFCDAMIQIRREIQAIEDGHSDIKDNVLKNAPHPILEISSDTWTHSYSRSEAAYPVPGLRQFKFWPAVSRIDNVYGDRNLQCTCPSLESYETPVEATA
ncbi:aminomethyl-transferring glycine dehydrogenase [bacterium]|jgi:glycine dehydrogenase|nr:aminomethyl-transferring glycine dehydrogenase [bacterium]